MKIIRIGLHPPSHIRGKFDLNHLGNDAVETLTVEAFALFLRRDPAAAKQWLAGQAEEMEIETVFSGKDATDRVLKLLNHPSQE